MNLSACIFLFFFFAGRPVLPQTCCFLAAGVGRIPRFPVKMKCQQHARLWLLHHHACQTKWGQSSLCSVMLCCIKVLMVVSLLLNCCKHASRPPPPPRLWTASSPWQSVGKLMRRGGVGFLPSTGTVPGWGCGSNRLIQKRNTHTQGRERLEENKGEKGWRKSNKTN